MAGGEGWRRCLPVAMSPCRELADLSLVLSQGYQTKEARPLARMSLWKGRAAGGWVLQGRGTWRMGSMGEGRTICESKVDTNIATGGWEARNVEAGRCLLMFIFVHGTRPAVYWAIYLDSVGAIE